MPAFGKTSTEHRAKLHPALQGAVDRVISWFDFKIIDSYRSPDVQEALFRSGKTNARAGQSKHNLNPSHALDALPCPISQEEWAEFVRDGRKSALFRRCAMLAGALIQAAREEGVELRWGGDWDRDENDLGAGFLDAPHLEIVGFLK